MSAASALATPSATLHALARTMPTVTIDTSATIADAAVPELISAMSLVLSKASGAPLEHVHINLRTACTMTWGSKLGGRDGNPHTAQLRLTLGSPLEAAAKNSIITGIGELLAPHAPQASTQFYFEDVSIENLAIDGLLLPDLIARDAPKA